MISGNYTAIQNHRTAQRQPGFSGIKVGESLKGTEFGKGLSWALKQDYFGHEQNLTDREGVDVAIEKDAKNYLLNLTRQNKPEAPPKIVVWKPVHTLDREYQRLKRGTDGTDGFNEYSAAREILKAQRTMNQPGGIDRIAEEAIKSASQK